MFQKTGGSPADLCQEPPATVLPFRGRLETLVLAVVLVAAYHGIQYWVFTLLPAWTIYRRWGPSAYSLLWDAVGLIVPSVLCLSAPRRSGLGLGRWSRGWQVAVVAAVPALATLAFCRYTSNPFKQGPIGTWLISPAAQEMMVSGFLYGLLASVFPGRIGQRLGIDKAVLMTAGLFVLWHTPNFCTIPARFVCFQLLYTFLGGICFLLARQWTGSILPSIAGHMAANFVAWAGW